ncbi:sigma-54 interaction domain-containing protein [Pseudalkalibacillus caeni]|uniref:PAS domain S-box protein n=1 Tax=Exobacillus caeni TaxID=2574798 RepID=A0A5R9F579_9BACL|nr:sigma 54-interacting transcriptional regulator [Pseudalkalibacillus caeni]TLS37629.1 PAS domain S-box protein [Pseudalkalibacillus caeni]
MPFPDTKQMLEAILSSIDEAIHAVDAKGMTIYYNHIAAQHDGLKVEEVLGRHFLDVFPSLSKETSTLSNVLRTKQPIYNKHQTYMNIKGKYIETVNTTLPILVQGKVAGAVEIAKDLTKVKQLSEKLIDLQARVNKKMKKENGNTSGAFFTLNDIITKNREIQQVKDTISKVANTSSPVLVYGETGTGKELVVQAIHNASIRANQPFVAQNCAALPPSILESILFGTVKGSFTGSVDREGLFELADGGTLFLDEINSMPLEIQAKLLRVLQDGIIRRIGALQTKKVNVRVIGALNEPPDRSIAENKLRADLYYRLKVVYFHIPPLRGRTEDIEPLVKHFINKFNNRFGKDVIGVDENVFKQFMAYSWPGNVRELEHVIESAMNLSDAGLLTTANIHLPVSDLESISNKKIIRPLRETMESTEKNLIEAALEETNGNIQQAAKLLGIPRQTLQYKLVKKSNNSR